MACHRGGQSSRDSDLLQPISSSSVSNSRVRFSQGAQTSAFLLRVDFPHSEQIGIPLLIVKCDSQPSQLLGHAGRNGFPVVFSYIAFRACSCCVDEWERDALTRLTFVGEANGYPVWTPDGQRIVYSSQEKGGAPNLWWIRADGAGITQRLAESKYFQSARSWSPNGKVLAFRQFNPDTNYDIMTLSIEGDENSGWKPGEPKPFVNSSFIEWEPTFSPDGRWLAYSSNESGSYEVYVRPFPGSGGKWQISTGGSLYSKRSRDGKELFYRTVDSKIMVVTYAASGDSFHADKPQLWSPGQFTERGIGNYNFDLHLDGKRFAVLKAPGTQQNVVVNHVSFIFNFFDELRRKLPSGK
jgi:dipeptidyl aminopeptidase/acylaminoacyl peptidase